MVSLCVTHLLQRAARGGLQQFRKVCSDFPRRRDAGRHHQKETQSINEEQLVPGYCHRWAEKVKPRTSSDPLFQGGMFKSCDFLPHEKYDKSCPRLAVVGTGTSNLRSINPRISREHQQLQACIRGSSYVSEVPSVPGRNWRCLKLTAR